MKSKYEIFLQWNTKFFLEKVLFHLHFQPVTTTRIYVLHKITIALNFVLHKFWFANSREETANPRLATYKTDQRLGSG